MGVHPKIGFLRFPAQGPWLGKRVRVLFDYDATMMIEGTIVRDDAEEPSRTIIHLDDGRFVLTTECQHSLPFDAPTRDPE
jgi:hypothetical protein